MPDATEREKLETEKFARILKERDTHLSDLKEPPLPEREEWATGKSDEAKDRMLKDHPPEVDEDEEEVYEDEEYDEEVGDGPATEETREQFRRHLDSQKPHVMIACPCNGSIQFVTANAILNLAQDQRFRRHVILGSQKPYENNQHLMVKQFLEGVQEHGETVKPEWLLMMDSDNPPTGNPLDYIEKDCDIVGFPTPVFQAQRDQPWHLNVYKQKSEWEFVPHTPCKGFVEVDATGSGCILLKRKVLETIPAPFASVWWPDGTRKLGGDLAFSVRARKAGFKIMAAFDCPCCHFTQIEGLRSIQQIDNHVRRIVKKVLAGEMPPPPDPDPKDQFNAHAYGLFGLKDDDKTTEHEKSG